MPVTKANPMRALALLLILIIPASARDTGQWSGKPIEAQNFYKSLHSRSGFLCCDDADGDDVQYDTREGKYWVYLDNQWIEVPDNALVDQPNPYGHARAWTYHEDGEIKIRCFLPGAGI
jgi:hypothetical protein